MGTGGGCGNGKRVLHLTGSGGDKSAFSCQHANRLEQLVELLCSCAHSPLCRGARADYMSVTGSHMTHLKSLCMLLWASACLWDPAWKADMGNLHKRRISCERPRLIEKRPRVGVWQPSGKDPGTLSTGGLGWGNMFTNSVNKPFVLGGLSFGIKKKFLCRVTWFYWHLYRMGRAAPRALTASY